MSLINTMLQDLEKRRASTPERSAVPRYVRVLPAEKERRTSRALWGGAIVLVAVTASTWILYDKAPAQTPPAPAWVAEASAATGEQQRIEAPAVPIARTAASEVSPTAMPRPIPTAEVVSPDPIAPTRPRKELRAVATIDPASAVPVRSKSEPDPPALQRTASPSISLSLRMDAISPERVVSSEARSQRHSGEPHIDRKVRELTPAQLAENEYRLGANLLNQGRHAEAHERFAQALRHVPAHIGARQALFGLLLQAKRTGEAEQLLQDALKIDLAQAGFAMALARLQVDRGNAVAAAETLQNSVHAAQANPDYLAFLAALYQRQGRHQQAVDTYQAALALAPRSGVWLMGLGLSLQALNRNSEAQEAFRAARSADGLSAELQAFVDQRLRQLR